MINMKKIIKLHICKAKICDLSGKKRKIGPCKFYFIPEGKKDFECIPY